VLLSRSRDTLAGPEPPGNTAGSKRRTRYGAVYRDTARGELGPDGVGRLALHDARVSLENPGSELTNQHGERGPEEVAGGWWRVAGKDLPSPATRHQPPATNHPPPTTCHPPPKLNLQLPGRPHLAAQPTVGIRIAHEFFLDRIPFQLLA